VIDASGLGANGPSLVIDQRRCLSMLLFSTLLPPRAMASVPMRVDEVAGRLAHRVPAVFVFRGEVGFPR
jgi:hypothetical protein